MHSSFKQPVLLNALKLKGFKSFARPTTILFSPGISAIVGPNGCGKSNLVDAIKWVLGEQGLKPLRSKTAEDLIFSGTDKRPPLSMAEVSLILEQLTNPAPAELMITRRVFRSGENNYLLNKHKCRLKDIREMLLNAGFGLKNYAIIDQGQVAQLLEFSPLEKRRLLEEAAGVTKYREKKEETLRKIEETKQNLLRLEDIIVEVETQVRKLSLQAKKAKEYLDIKEMLNKVHLSLLLKTYHTKEITLKEKTNQAEALKQKQAELGSQYQNLSKELEKTKQAIAITQQRLKEQEQSLWEIKTNIKQAAFMLDKLDEQKRDYEKRVATLKRRKEQLIAETEELSKQKEGIVQEIVTLIDQIATTQKAIQSLQSEIVLIEDKIKKNKPILKEKTRILDEIKQHLVKIDAELEHFIHEQRRINQQREEEERRSAELENKTKECVKKIENICINLERVNAKIEALKSRQKTARQNYDTLLSKTQRWQKALLKLEEASIRFKSQLKTVKLWLERHRPGQVLGADEAMGQIMDIITDARGLEDAVEAVLRLKTGAGWLVKDLNSALKILSTQPAQKLISLVLLDIKISPCLPSADNIPGTPLLDIIQVKEEYKSLGTRLLGNVFVVESLPQDLSACPTNVMFVNPEGKILTGEGVIHRGHSQGILKEYLRQKKLYAHLEKQLKSLEYKLPLVKKRVEETKAKLKQEELFLKKAEEEIAYYKKERDKLKELEIQQREFLKYASLQKEELEKKLLEIKKEKEYIEKKNQNRKEQKVKLKEELKRLEAETQSLKHAIKETLDLKEEKDRLLHQYTWKNQEATKKKEYLEKEKKRLEKHRQELEVQNEEVLAELEEMANRKTMMERQRKDAEENINRYKTEETKLKQIIEELKQNLNSFSEQKKKTIDKIKDLEIKIHALTEKLRGLDLEISKLTGEKDILKERLQKEYSISDKISSLLPPLDLPETTLEQKKVELQNKLEKIQTVNLSAIEEYEQISERYDFLKSQKKDLKNSLKDLERAIKKIDNLSVNLFLSTLEAANQKFQALLQFVFGESQGEIYLIEPAHPLTSGVEFKVRLPGKRVKHHLFSMGERCLISLIFLFSLYFVKPSPFCILDEADAGLDERNLDRFCNLLHQLKTQMQLIVITHNRATMKAADQLIGVTMEEKGISQIVTIPTS
ncbi:MAG: chromosome segregation protein SMC [Candidatus Desulfofervidaceae bacterium]|nr:chromosome segregation protein SMC [Candidatus Desulfofervidaceae bacterium]